MSDAPRNPRRLPPRIVPVARVVPASLPVRRADLQPPAAPQASRPRAYGTPLAASTRFPRMPQPTGVAVPADAPPLSDKAGPAALPEPALAPRDRIPREQGGDAGAGGAAADTLILWEQPPQPGPDSLHAQPRWIRDVSLMPTEAEFIELGSYVAFMLDGLTEFCRNPSVVESGQWHARLDMPEVVLPQTVLELEITSLHVKLRFESENQVARGVLERFGTALQTQVKASLADDRTVEVVLW